MLSGLEWFTRYYEGLQRIPRVYWDYKGIKETTRVYKVFQRFTGDNKGVEGGRWD